MWKYIIAPLLGGVIGYITNDLAIRMLFHPYKPLYIGKWRLPFTPGLIPSQKDRIAKSLGGVISRQLLNAETIRREALSDDKREKLRAAILGWLETQAASELTVRQTLEKHVDGEKVDLWRDRIVDAGSDFIMKKLKEASLGEMVAAELLDSIRAKLKPLGLDRILDGLSGTVAATVEAKIDEKGPALIHEKLEGIARDALENRVSDAAAPVQPRIPELADKAMEIYENLLTDNLETLLDAAKLDVIVENKIASFDAAQLEQLIFGIMRRELRAIVYLGAALGFMLGFVNLLF